jgi:hypothetical protein
LYDGLCADPDVFGIFWVLDGPSTRKMKKVPKETFEDLLGGIYVYQVRLSKTICFRDY